MTDSFFDVVLWPTFIGGVALGIIMILALAALTCIQYFQGMVIKHDINWKAIAKGVWIVFSVLAVSWFLGSRILVIYYE